MFSTLCIHPAHSLHAMLGSLHAHGTASKHTASCSGVAAMQSYRLAKSAPNISAGSHDLTALTTLQWLSEPQKQQHMCVHCAETKASEEAHPAEAAPRQKASSKIGPAAYLLMQEHDLKPEDITPTGPQGIITKGDVLEALATGTSKQQPSAEKQPQSKPQAQAVESKSKESAGSPPIEQKQHSDRQLEASKTGPSKASQQPDEGKAGGKKGKGPQYTDTPNSQIRKIIAQRLLESKQQIPALYVSATADVDAVSALRQSLKDQGQKVTMAVCTTYLVCSNTQQLCSRFQPFAPHSNALE